SATAPTTPNRKSTWRRSCCRKRSARTACGARSSKSRTEKEKGGRVSPPALPVFPACPRSALEREPEPDLTHALFRTLRVAGERRRLQQVRIRRPRGRNVDARAEAARVDRVEQVEHLADRFDVRAAAEAEDLRDAEVQLLLRHAAP